MKTATLRDLRYSFPKIEAWLRAGEKVEITRHAKPIAHLAPPTKSKAPKFDVKEHRARLRRIWGDRVFSAAEVEEMRAFETGEP
jgi:antitoxin (DNA-binding transcriptional repressor) of toxin-antitoxin stability system